MELSKDFWENRYQNNDIGWDVGEVTTPLKAYFDQLEDKSLSILIPGAGNAYEAEYLHNQGFKNVVVIDIAPTAISKFKERVTNFPEEQVINQNFFDFEGQFDIIVEQTFFCAIDKNLREEYANQVHKLLKPKGKLVGLMFNAPLNDDHPPFGGSVEEYKMYFNPLFDIEIMDSAYNSILPRSGREVFVKLVRN
ncbi:MAG: methyltransferase domain-containing protein [Vicingaceae bacterium]